MKVKNVNLNTLLYIVTADIIKAINPEAVQKMESGRIRITIRNPYSTSIEASPEDERIENFYLNFPDARKKQCEIRKNQIKEAYGEMQEAIENYNKLVEKYFDKPLTSDSEVKVIKY